LKGKGDVGRTTPNAPYTQSTPSPDPKTDFFFQTRGNTHPCWKKGKGFSHWGRKKIRGEEKLPRGIPHEDKRVSLHLHKVRKKQHLGGGNNHLGHLLPVEKKKKQLHMNRELWKRGGAMLAKLLQKEMKEKEANQKRKTIIGGTFPKENPTGHPIGRGKIVFESQVKA